MSPKLIVCADLSFLPLELFFSFFLSTAIKHCYAIPNSSPSSESLPSLSLFHSSIFLTVLSALSLMDFVLSFSLLIGALVFTNLAVDVCPLPHYQSHSEVLFPDPHLYLSLYFKSNCFLVLPSTTCPLFWTVSDTQTSPHLMLHSPQTS